MSHYDTVSLFSFILLGIVFAFAVLLLKLWKIDASSKGAWPGAGLFGLACILVGVGVLVGAHARVYPYVSAYTWDLIGMGYSRMEPIPFPAKGTDFTFDSTTRILKMLKTPPETRWGINMPSERGGKFISGEEFVLPTGVDVDKVEVYFQHIDGRTSSSVSLN